MAVSDDQIAFATDLFAQIPDLSWRKMMGGLSTYSGGQIFAIMDSDGQIFLKASGQFARLLTDQGAHIFSFSKKNGSSGTMGYLTLPEPALDDPELACDWAQQALAALT